MKGKLIGVGVGPGDPKLLTVKAIEAIKGADYVAYPTSGIQANGERSSNVALRIIREHIEGKELLEYLMPMSRDKEYVQRCHDECADDIKKYLDEGKTVAFVTLGDPAIYSTYILYSSQADEAGLSYGADSGDPLLLCGGSESEYQPLRGRAAARNHSGEL